MSDKKNAYKDSFVFTSNIFEEIVEKVENQENRSLCTELNYYGAFIRNTIKETAHIVKNGLNIEFGVLLEPIMKQDKKVRNQSVFVDFELMNLNGKMKTITEEKFYPINLLNNYRNQIEEENRKTIEELILFLNDENRSVLNLEKVKRLKVKIGGITEKKVSVRYLVLSLFMYLCQKEQELSMNGAILEILQEALMDCFPTLFASEKVDYQYVYFLLFVVYEIYGQKLSNSPQQFSEKLERFIKRFGVWYSAEFWEEFLKLSKKVVMNPLISYNVWVPKGNKKVHSKVRMTNYSKIYEFAINVGFYLLKLPFEILFDILNEVNENHKHVNMHVIVELSKQLEPNLEKNYSTRKISIREMVLSIDRDNAIRICLKEVLKYLNPKKDGIMNLIFLNKLFFKNFRKAVFKRILAGSINDKNLQVRLWVGIAECDQILMGIIRRMKDEQESDTSPGFENANNLIIMDVKRTAFVKPEFKKALEKMLFQTASHFTNLSYYQGMNCIAGFLLNYTDNVEQATKVFNYLTLKKLDVYFRNNFGLLDKMQFICRRLIKRLNPFFDLVLSKNDISEEYYLSSLLLTVFTTTLQFEDASSVVSRVFDCLIAGGWTEVFKLVVYLSFQMNLAVERLKQEELLVFFKRNIYGIIGKLSVEELVGQVWEIPVTKNEIRVIAKEYERTKFVVHVYWSRYWDARRANFGKKQGKD